VSQIAAEVNDLSRRARDKRLTPADVADGTFTVTNLGPLGIEQFTAIINPPQAAILAVGAMQKEVMVLPDDHVQDAAIPGDLALGNASAGNGIVVRPVMRMTLSVDHRIVDGAVAAHFLRDLREGLEVPALLLW
jgi:pyruvate dehydrogenase E2 component (dihydrolipoamide acetyltransferase)